MGHVFKLGTMFSEKLGAYFLDQNGAQKPIVMGSYGIGVGRLLATVIEQNHDDKGIVWPVSLAPYHVYLCALGMDKPDVVAATDKLYSDLQAAGVEVLFDDRTESAGVRFNDADLLGMPLRVVVSQRTLKSQSAELKWRSKGESETLPLEGLAEKIAGLLAGLGCSSQSLAGPPRRTLLSASLNSVREWRRFGVTDADLLRSDHHRRHRAAIGFAVWSSRMKDKRRKELAGWAQANGFKFLPEKDHSVWLRYEPFKCLQRGDNRYAYNIMLGTAGQRVTCGFDYHYETHSTNSKGQRQTHHHHFSALVVDAGLPLKPLFIRPEGFFDKVTEFVGFDDIDFESAEFSQKFCVKSPDRRWAYDVLHQKTMELMLAYPALPHRVPGHPGHGLLRQTGRSPWGNSSRRSRW